MKRTKTKGWLIRVVLALILIHTFLFVQDLLGDQRVSDKGIIAIYTPVLSFVNNSTDSVVDLFDRYVWLVNTKEKNQQLMQLNQVLRLQNQSLMQKLSVQLEEDQIIDALNEQGFYKVLPAKILMYDPFLPSKTMVINKGQSDGVKINDLIIVAEGLVGKVVDVFDSSSRILLLVDYHFSVDSINERTGIRCVVRGWRESRIQAHKIPYLSQIEYLQQNLSMKEGDFLFTSGLGSVFPAGLKVGRIIEDMQDGKFKVLPAVDFTKLNKVFVLTNQKVKDQS